MQHGADQRGTNLGLARALSPTGAFIIVLDAEKQVVWSVNVPKSWAAKTGPEPPLRQFLDAEAGVIVDDAIASVVADREAVQLEVPVPVADGTSWYAVWVNVHAGDDEPDSLIITGMDITDQKHREQTLRTLLREVAHRSKNLLAIIQSIATQTGRHADSVDSFLTRFRGRIQSMASTQDLVTSSNWRGADLRELVNSQVGRYVADPALSVHLTGEFPYLNPNAALHIGLALHELAVNSVSFGALANADGFVSIAVTRAGPAHDSDLTLVWTETVLQPGPNNGQKRFGSTALERVVPAAIGGTAQMLIEPGRLTYTLVIPSANFVTG